jgi:Nuclease-related domain
MTWKEGLIYLGYLALFFGSISLMLWRHRQVRKSRLPFEENLKLLRGPGETQLRLIRQFDEDGFMWMILAAIIPATLGLGLLLITLRLPEALQLGGAALSLGIFVIAFRQASRCYTQKAQESSNRYLGYFGERLVAEHLEPMKSQGWRIFHDVPAAVDGASFNIDHIAVGPAGIFVLETKTRRKGRARPGFDDHKVYFDGQSLVWPWGEDNHGLEQAERSARWLSDLVRDEIGDRAFVAPVLVLPGWVVEMKPAQMPRLCQVTNPQGLDQMLPVAPSVVDLRLVDAISAKLEARCRDVEY